MKVKKLTELGQHLRPQFLHQYYASLAESYLINLNAHEEACLPAFED